jgi:hypothetical protein
LAALCAQLEVLPEFVIETAERPALEVGMIRLNRDADGNPIGITWQTPHEWVEEAVSGWALLNRQWAKPQELAARDRDHRMQAARGEVLAAFVRGISTRPLKSTSLGCS